MAFGGHELLLIVRAQNQASQALRRVATDVSRLGGIRAMQLRQQQLALEGSRRIVTQQRVQSRIEGIAEAQAKSRALAQQRLNRTEIVGQGLMNQRAGLMRRIGAMESEQGARSLALDAQIMRANAVKLRAQVAEERATSRLKGARKTLNDAVSQGVITEAQSAEVMTQLERMQLAAQFTHAAAAKNIQRLSAVQKDYNRTLTETRGRLANVNARILENERRGVSATEAQRVEQARLRRSMAIAQTDLANATRAVALNAQQQRELARAISAAKWERFQTGSRIVTHLGRVMQMAGLVGGAALGYLAKGAADFNSQVRLVATQTGPIGSGFQQISRNADYLQEALLGVMRQGTATRDELSQAAYDIYSSLTLPGRNVRQLRTGVDILRQLNKAAIAGATPLQDVTAGVIAVLGAFKEIQPTGANVERLLNRMFAGVRFGRFTFRELAGVMGTVAPAARAAGQSFDTMIGSLAFLSRPLGINKAAVGFARLTEILSRQKMVKGLKDLGVNIVDANGKLLQLPDIIDKITTKFPNLTKGGVALTQFFKKISGTEGTIQARRAFVFLSQQLDRYRLVLGQSSRDNNEFRRSFVGMSRSAGVQFGIFINNLKAFGLMLGEAVLPNLVKITKPLADLAHWFENLDASTRRSIGKWATYTAAILLVGGTFVSVAGMLASFIGMMGRFGLAGAAFISTIMAIVAAIMILKGDWGSLSDAISSGVNTMLGSFKGFVAMSALVVAAALQIRKAFLGLAAIRTAAVLGAAEGGAAAGGIRGLAAGIGGATAAGGAASRLARAEQGAGRLRAALVGAGAAIAALPGGLLVAGGAIAAAAAAAGLWKLHMQGVEQHTERIAHFQQEVRNLASATVEPLRRFGGLGLAARDVLRQRNAVAELNAQIADTRKQLQAASAADRPALRRQLTDLYIQQADATDALHQANARANQSFEAFTTVIQKQLTTLQALGNAQRNLKREQAELRAERAKLVTDPFAADPVKINRLREGIQNLKGEINLLAPAARRGASELSRAFTRNIRQLQQIRQLPARITPVAMRAGLDLAMRRGRMITAPEMRTVVRAVADPQSLRKLPRDIQAAVRTARVQVRVEADQARVRRILVPGIRKAMSGMDKFLRAVGVKVEAKSDHGKAIAARKDIAEVFAKTIHQRTAIDSPQPSAVSIGASMADGIRAGFGSVDLAVHINATINKTINKVVGNLEAGSPSRKTARMIGVPMMQGIIMGIASQFNALERTSALAVDFFQGPWLTSDAFTNATKRRGKDIDNLHRRIDKMRRTGDTASKTYKRLQRELATAPRARTATFKDLEKDLAMSLRLMVMFNRGMERLRRRGVPLMLLQQLAQLGTEGAKYIKILADSSNRQLRRYVGLWQRAQRAITRSMRPDWANLVQEAGQNLLDRWNEIHDNLVDNWLSLTRSLDKFNEKNSDSLEDLTQQLADANQQIADITEQMRDKVSQEFGNLFEGAYLASQQIQNKLDWGIALNMDDLMRDLQSQVNAFNSWRADLLSLAKRVPAGLLKELTDLGPQAAGMIHTLATASAAELAQYVILWQQKVAAINKAMGDILPDKDEFKKQMSDVLSQIKVLLQQIADAKKPKVLAPADIIGDLQQQQQQFQTFSQVMASLKKRNVPQELLNQLAQMGPDALPLLQGLNSMTDAQLGQYLALWKNMNEGLKKLTNQFMVNQINEWKSHGKNIALALISGIMGEQEGLLKFFRNLFRNLLKEAKKETKSHSPSLVYEALGKDIVFGMGRGMDRAGRNLRVPLPAVGGYGSGYGQQPPITMHVHAHHDESLMTTMQRAAFRLRNRRV